MNKTTIKVPAGIRYIGTWQDFHLSNFPAKCIINKVLPGCGFTRYCIESKWENIILCSPRKMLLQNKYEQHRAQAYLVVNQYEKSLEVDHDIENDRERLAKASNDRVISIPQPVIQDEYEDPMKDHHTEIKARLHRELREYMSGHMQGWKILVTYDSFRVVKEVLTEMGVFQNFFVVIDEMQAIMSDARFKSSTEINFLYHLQNSHSAIFVSATPMLEEYLDELAEFRDLPYYELDWKAEDFTRIVRPDFDVQMMDVTILTIAKRIISDFLEGKRDQVTVLRGGIPVQIVANELVFYLNSVNAIISIINSCGLTDDQVNILCSNTESNQKRIWKRLGKKNGYNIGRVPLEGEPRKPFTFCTRTVYLGADFYSDCAKSYIFSDANSKYLSIDVSQDLPQILGRQRCDLNPWKNSATFYYKLTDATKKGFDFESLMDIKRADTKRLLDVWNSTQDDHSRDTLSGVLSDNIKAYHYEKNYIAVNKVEVTNQETGEKSYKMVPVENHLVRVSEKRAFDIQQIDYADRFSVFTAMQTEFGTYIKGSSDQNPIEFQVQEFFREYDTRAKVSDKLRLLCEVHITEEARAAVLLQISETDKVKFYYQAVGPERCKACGYLPGRIEKECGIKFYSKKTLEEEIYSRFQVGQKVLLAEAKNILAEIYSNIHYQATPKATDLKKYFEVSDYKATDKETRKRVRGYELIRKLQ